MNKDQEKKELESHLVKTTKQSGIVFISKFIGYILGFAINFIMARYYGAEIMGQYTLINTYIQMILIFTIFGLDNGMVKYVARYNSKNDEKTVYKVIKIALTYTIILSLIGTIITFVFRKYIGLIFNDNILANSLVIGSFLIIPRTINRLFGGIYRGFKQIKYYILAKQVYTKLIRIVLLIIFIFFNIDTLNNVIITLLISSLFISIFLFYQFKNFDINLKKIIFDIFNFNNNNKKIRNQLLSYSSTMILISFMSVILSRTDRVMIGIFSSSSSVGIYNIAATVGGLATFLLSSSNMAFAPIISELYTQDKVSILNDLYSTITKWIVMFTLPIIVTIIIFPETILSVFGAEYIDAKYVLILIALGHMINAFVGANGLILNMSGHERFELYNNIMMSVINIILNLILIPRFGILGAAIATCLSITTINILKVIEVKKYLNIFPYNKEFLITLLGFLVNVGFALSVKIYFNNIGVVIIITTINLLLSLVLLFINKNELDLLLFKRVKNKLLTYF